MPENTPEFGFTLKATDGLARRGTLTTAWGRVETPVFMPVGTAATVKGMMPESLASTGASIILANTYHLMLRPGAERVARLGGVRKMMGWDGPLLTDSGGFQVFSLGTMRKITESGVLFRSPVDGAKVFMTPELSMQIQRELGSDIVMVFDECTSFPATEMEVAQSMHLSLRWSQRSKTAHGDNPSALFGIVQGGMYEHLRDESLAGLMQIGFDGYAIGGLSVGEPKQSMLRILSYLAPKLPSDKPRYLMGVGRPEDLVEGVRRGVDMFDCVMPTRAGRHGTAYTWRGMVNIRNARHKHDPRPLDEASACPASSQYSRAYLHHLHRCGEYLGAMLLTWHNLAFYQELMAAMRVAIKEGRFEDFRADFKARQAGGDMPPYDG